MKPFSDMTDEELIDLANMKSIREPASYEFACRLHRANLQIDRLQDALIRCRVTAARALDAEED